MDPDLAQDAINQALNGRWPDAIKANEKILQIDSQNIDALNRLARAYCECGKVTKAKTIAKKVIKIDPFNTIAAKCLKKWELLKDLPAQAGNGTTKVMPKVFLEDPSKTKIINLIKLGDKKTIAQLDCGDVVQVSPHAHTVSVLTSDGKQIGKLPDDLAVKVITAMKLGIEHEAVIKTAFKNEVKIFLREINN